MTPQSAKAKGRKLQQLVRDRLLAAFPALEPGDVRSTSMGNGGEDIQLSPAARKLIPFGIECKARAKGLKLLYDWLDQAAEHGTGTPLLVVKQDRFTPLVVVELDAFLGVLSGGRGQGQGG
jgi:hypothetical protein